MYSTRSPRSRLGYDASSIDPLPLLGGHWIGAGIVIAIVVDASLLAWARLCIDVSWTSIGYTLGAAIAGIICYAFRAGSTRSQRVIRDLSESVSLFAAISLAAVIASYPLATVRRGFADRRLEHIDLDLHFHWISWYDFVVDHPWLQPLERAAYQSIFVTPALLFIYFAWTGRRADSRLFLATFWVAASMTLALFPLVPAAGPLATLWHGAVPYMPLSAFYQDHVILALRLHAIHDVDLGALHGLVSAPSFHAAAAIVYIATAWRVIPLRWPIAALNVAMLLATPIEGTHYLVDLLSGILVAFLALYLTQILVRTTGAGCAIESREIWTSVCPAAE